MSKLFLPFGQNSAHRPVEHRVHDDNEDQDINDLNDNSYINGNHFKGLLINKCLLFGALKPYE